MHKKTIRRPTTRVLPAVPSVPPPPSVETARTPRSSTASMPVDSSTSAGPMIY